MKKWILSFIVSLFAVFPAFGALSALDQSLKEIRTILDSSELRNGLQPNETIQDIWKVGGRYVISTETRQMTVEIAYSPRKTPGPQEFTLTFHPARAYGE